MTRIGIKIVGAETGFQQFRRSVALPHRPLAGAKHAYSGRAFFFQCIFEFQLHDIKGFLPTDRSKITFFIILSVFHPQQRLGQAVFAVHDFRQEIAFHAVQPTIDR
ncbi:Uncharacterised protein [Yersinia enterocolitica]|nr:Uncharacterised protein [Yersinia enterocolitica]